MAEENIVLISTSISLLFDFLIELLKYCRKSKCRISYQDKTNSDIKI